MPETRPLQVAVVTGHHPFDVRPFHAMLRGLDGVCPEVMHMEDWVTDVGGRRGEYDAVCFYHMYSEPLEAARPWYEAQLIGALSSLGETSQGIVLLHHSLVAFPDWPFWSELVGAEQRVVEWDFDQTVTLTPVDLDHPITRGLAPWTMVDETYLMPGVDAAAGNHVLLTTDHPRSVPTLAWTRQFRAARVFCWQSGHGAGAFDHPQFREVLARGLRWTADR